MARASALRSANAAVGASGGSADVMTVTVVSLHDHPWKLKIPKNDTVASLKRKILEHYSTSRGCSVPPANVDLRMKATHASQGFRLDGRKLLEHYNVQDGSSIYCLFRAPPRAQQDAASPAPKPSPAAAPVPVPDPVPAPAPAASPPPSEAQAPAPAPPPAERTEFRGAIIVPASAAAAGAGGSRAAGRSPLAASRRREGGVRETYEAVRGFNRQQARRERGNNDDDDDDDFLESPRVTTRQPGDRKILVRWTDRHVRDLVKGVERHGLGRWRAILADPGLVFPDDANQVTLKDRWRNLCLTVEKEKVPRGWTLTNELRMRILNIIGAEG